MEEIFKFCECIPAILLLSPIVKRCGLSIWTNLNPLHPGLLFAKLGWNWFCRKRFLNFLYLVIISPWKRLGPFIWINFTQWCFVLSIVEIGRLVLEKKIFKLVNVFQLFHNYLPLEKCGALHLNKLESPLSRMLCVKFGWNWPTGSGE